jgi:O-succinylbenzoate synthase
MKHRFTFSFEPYQRQFKQPLQTHHGQWSLRQGIVVQLKHMNGQVGVGEIAPLPWFGSERYTEAIAFCQNLPSSFDLDTIQAIPGAYPACQFGLESAWENLQPQTQHIPPLSNFTYCGLLPSGSAALQSWPLLWRQGYRTFKWKIGMKPLKTELDWFQVLSQSLPCGAKLRLDANGGLTERETWAWLATCEDSAVEFLEQPLPPTEFEALLQLSQRSPVPIALDESVATIPQLETCYRRGWSGVVVIKPAIAGFPSRLRQFCRVHQPDVVFSSVFEGAIAREAVLKLATECPTSRALGFGVDHWFEN